MRVESKKNGKTAVMKEIEVVPASESHINKPDSQRLFKFSYLLITGGDDLVRENDSPEMKLFDDFVNGKTTKMFDCVVSAVDAYCKDLKTYRFVLAAIFRIVLEDTPGARSEFLRTFLRYSLSQQCKFLACVYAWRYLGSEDAEISAFTELAVCGSDIALKDLLATDLPERKASDQAAGLLSEAIDRWFDHPKHVEKIAKFVHELALLRESGRLDVKQGSCLELVLTNSDTG